MIELRDYQSELIEACRAEYRAGAQRVCLVAPTGAGKTVIFSFICRSAVEKGLKVMVLAHRSEILNQIEATLREVGVPVGVIRSGNHSPIENGVNVCSIQTLVRRFDRTPVPNFVVVDECAHAVAGTWLKVGEKYASARFLGVTAAPERLDGKGLGSVFEKLVLGPSTQSLIDLGYLARPRYIGVANPVDVSKLAVRAGDYAKEESADLMDRPSITGDAVAHYKRYLDGRTAIAFCVNLQHAAHVSESFRAAGVPSAVIDGEMNASDRRKRTDDLSAGAVKVLVSVDVIAEGYDCPSVGGAILLRPTKSLALHLQQIGRCLRPKPDGSDAMILDHVGNLERHGPAEEVRAWSLDGRSARKRSEEAKLDFRRCLKCFRIFQGTVCPECGTVRASKAREIEEREGELRALEAAELIAKRQARVQIGRAQTLQELIAIGKARGYAPKWAFIRWQISKKNPVNRHVGNREAVLR